MNSENIQDKLEKIRLSYVSSLIEKKEAIDTHWQSLKTSWDQEIKNAMYLIIHGIAGSAETFGMPELTQQARTVLDLLKKVKPDSIDENLMNKIDNEIGGLLKKLKTANAID